METLQDKAINQFPRKIEAKLRKTVSKFSRVTGKTVKKSTLHLHFPS